MTGNDQANTHEGDTLSRSQGKERAEEFQLKKKPDPFPRIPHALLSADDIKRYVLATGAVAPFDPREESGRLKKAAYEGRIGDLVYEFNEKAALVRISNNPLVVKANSIVFVESDIDFRLPDFIALRFNLQIRHVHRGLLLGTGPLVDPGYWGKLCIPLHNLTDENYLIPREEGLVWIEFTKTSLKKKKGATTFGLNALREQPDGYWCIKDLIDKAAKPIGEEGKTVAIRSSIPIMSKKATERAVKAEESASEARRWVEKTAHIGIATILISLFALACAFYSNIQSAYNSLAPQIDNLREDVSELRNATYKIKALTDENEKLRERVRRLEGNKSESDDLSPQQ